MATTTTKRSSKATAYPRDNFAVSHPQVGQSQQVPFGSIHVDEARFQVRSAEALTYVAGQLKKQEGREQVRKLLEVLEAGKTLNAMIVWKDAAGTRWVIDGHHRQKAYAEHGTAPDARVWVQHFTGVTEAEARAYALAVNSQDHLNLHPDEKLNSYWRRVLCGEVTGTVRGRAQQYMVGVSTVTRMDKAKPEVLQRLQAEAVEAGEEFGSTYILRHAPSWKELSGWREANSSKPTDDLDRKRVEALLTKLTAHLGKAAKTQPDELLEAFEEFYSEATGRTITIRRESVEGDEDEDLGF